MKGGHADYEEVFNEVFEMMLGGLWGECREDVGNNSGMYVGMDVGMPEANEDIWSGVSRNGNWDD